MHTKAFVETANEVQKILRDSDINVCAQAGTLFLARYLHAAARRVGERVRLGVIHHQGEPRKRPGALNVLVRLQPQATNFSNENVENWGIIIKKISLSAMHRRL